MTKSELYSEISVAAQQIETMSASGKNVSKERERFKNVLITYVPDILKYLEEETVVNEIDPAEVQDLKDELEVAGDALAEADAKVKVLKFLMKENGLDPNKLLADYEAGLHSKEDGKGVTKGGKKQQT